MKILFLQNMQDSLGGVTIVNISLAKAFQEQGHVVGIYSLRNGLERQQVDYPKEIERKLINAKEKWNCPRYQEVIENLKIGKILQGIRKFQERKQYDKILFQDYAKMKEAIETFCPDIIINSHYELLQAIPEKDLRKTINHYHTNFSQVLESRTQLQFLKKYQNKIGKFIWLTEESCQMAKKQGLEKSMTIYNPIRFETEKRSKVKENKTAVFLGRISEEKRLELAIDIFTEILQKEEFPDWNFNIYAVGELTKSIKKKIEENPQIQFMGRTDDPKEVLLQAGIMILTSKFEGFPLTVLEANECGVPVISFQFGETAKEIINENTGVLVEQDHKEEYEKKLIELMKEGEKRETLSIGAKEFAKKFTITQIQNYWYHLFQEIQEKNN